MIYKVKIGMMYDHKGRVLHEGQEVEHDGPLNAYQDARLVLAKDYGKEPATVEPVAKEKQTITAQAKEEK